MCVCRKKESLGQELVNNAVQLLAKTYLIHAAHIQFGILVRTLSLLMYMKIPGRNVMLNVK
jgi:hypothetical protein